MVTDEDCTAMPEMIETSLGELVSAVYQEFLEAYGDPELASVATAALVNDMLSEDHEQPAAARVA